MMAWRTSAGVRRRLMKLAAALLVVVQLSHPAAAAPSQGASSLRIMVEPDDRKEWLLKLLNRAQRTIFVECYLVTDRQVIRALERAANEGVRVYVLLERHPYGLGNLPERTAELLAAAGVAVRWSPLRHGYLHAKFAVIDDGLAIVSTANLSASAFRHNREFLTIDRRRVDVRFLSQMFRSDWDQLPVPRVPAPFIVSPVNSRTALTSLLLSARRSIEIYGEEVADSLTERLLGRLERKGVRISVLLPRGATPAGAAWLVRAQVAVREASAPYIHAKAFLIDGRRAFLGSENLSAQSLDRNREVGLTLPSGQMSRLEDAFSADWRRGRPVSGRTGLPASNGG